MRISDKERYQTTCPENDMLGLGENPNLCALDKETVRKQFTFMDKESLSDRERAIRFLLNRIEDYYCVVGYVGPYIGSSNTEIGFALAGWNVERGHSPWREAFTTENRYQWENPRKVFNKVRYMCFETALLLAAFEVSKEVPESKEALKRAAYAARNAIENHCGQTWSSIRKRKGSAGMRKVLGSVIRNLEGLRLVQGKNWNGCFEPVSNVAV